MKTKLSMIALLACLLPGCELTRDSGLWRGSISPTDSFEMNENCELEIELTRTSETLIVHTVNMGCPRYSYQWRVGAFDVFGGGVWKYGRRIGNIDPNGEVDLELTDAVVDEPLPMGYRSMRLRWNRVGSELQFWQETESFGRYRVSRGWLRRAR